MSLVDWLKGLTERPEGEGAGAASPKTGGRVRTRPPRAGRESYAKEWVKVLEENAADHDPFNTYTWELKPDEATGAITPQTAKPAVKLAAKTAKQQPDVFDTYTWELQEGDTPDDPWGLKKDPPPEKPIRKDGVNPYDTGVFDATWTGRFDKR